MTPSPPNKRPPAHVARHAGVAASDGTATASLGLHAAICGFASSSSKDGGSPSKTEPYAGPGRLTRRRARQIPFRSAEKTSRGAPGVAPAHGASSGLPLTELLNTRPLTGPRTPAIACRPREDVARPFAGDGEVGKLEGGCGARPELRPEAPAGGARRRLPRHAHGALLRAGADRGHPARSRLQGPAGDRAEAQARRGAWSRSGSARAAPSAH